MIQPHVCTTVTWLIWFLAIAVIDLAQHRIPNYFIVGGVAFAVLFSCLDSFYVPVYTRPFLPVNSLVSGLSCAVVMGGIFAIAARAEYGFMGMGDVKLVALIGLVLGFPLIVFAILISALVALITVWVLIKRGRTIKSMLPLGTFLCAGAIGALLLPESLIRMVF